MQEALAAFEIEAAAKRGCDRHRTAGANGFLDCPEGFFFVFRLNQDQTRRVEAERIQAMAVWLPPASELLRGKDEQKRRRARHAGEQSHEEAERGGAVCFACGGDFVHGSEGKATFGQALIERRKAKWQTTVFVIRQALNAGQPAAQILHQHLAAQAFLCCFGRHASLFLAHEMAKKSLEQNKNIARGRLQALAGSSDR